MLLCYYPLVKDLLTAQTYGCQQRESLVRTRMWFSIETEGSIQCGRKDKKKAVVLVGVAEKFNKYNLQMILNQGDTSLSSPMQLIVRYHLLANK